MSVPTPEPQQTAQEQFPTVAGLMQGLGDTKYREIAMKVLGYIMESSVSAEILSVMNPQEAENDPDRRVEEYLQLFFQKVQGTGLKAAELASSELVKRWAAGILVFVPLIAADVIKGDQLIEAIIHAPLQVLTAGNKTLDSETVKELIKAIHGDHEAMAKFWEEFADAMGDKLSDVLWEVFKDVGIIALLLKFMRKRAETAELQKDAKASGEAPIVVPKETVFVYAGNGDSAITPLMHQGAGGSITAIPLIEGKMDNTPRRHPGYLALGNGADMNEALERLHVSPQNLVNGALLMVGLAGIEGQELTAQHDFSIDAFALALQRLQRLYAEHNIPVPQTMGIFIGHADAQATDEDGNPITAEEAAQAIGVKIFADIKDFVADAINDVLQRYPQNELAEHGIRVVAAEEDARKALKERLAAKGVTVKEKTGESSQTVCIIAHANSAATLAQALHLRDTQPDKPLVIVVSSITVKDEAEARERHIDVISIADVTHGAVVEVVGMFQRTGDTSEIEAMLGQLKGTRRAS